MPGKTFFDPGLSQRTPDGSERMVGQYGQNPGDDGWFTTEDVTRYAAQYCLYLYNTSSSALQKKSLLHKQGLNANDTFVCQYFGNDRQEASKASWRVVSGVTLKTIGTVEYVNGTGLLIHGAYHVFALVVEPGGFVDVRCVGVKLDGSTTGQNSLLTTLRDAARALKWTLTGCGTLALNSTLDMTKANLDWSRLKIQAVTPFSGTVILKVGGDTTNAESLKVSTYVWGDGPSWSKSSSDSVLGTNSALTGVQIVDDNSGNSVYEIHASYVGIGCEIWGNSEKLRIFLHCVYVTLMCKETESGGNSPDTNEIWLTGTDNKRCYESADSTSSIVHYLVESTIDDGTTVAADYDGVTQIPVSESKIQDGKFVEIGSGRRRGANRRRMWHIDKASNGGVDGVLFNWPSVVHAYGTPVVCDRARHLRGGIYLHDIYNGRSSIKADAAATGNLLTFNALAGTLTNSTKLSGTGGLAEANVANSDFAAGDTIIINGTTITVQASGASGNDVNVTDDIGTLVGKIQTILRANGGTGAVSTCVWQFSSNNNKIALTTQDTNQQLTIGGTAYSKIGLTPGSFNVPCPAVQINDVIDGAFQINADKIYNRECVRVGDATANLYPTNVEFGPWSISMGDPDPAAGIYAPTTTNAVVIEKMVGGSISPLYCHGNIKLEAGCQNVQIRVSVTWLKCGYKIIADPAATYSLRVLGRAKVDDFLNKAWVGNGFSVESVSDYGGVPVSYDNGRWTVPGPPQKATSAELLSVSSFFNSKVKVDGLLVKDTTLGKVLQAAGDADTAGWNDMNGNSVHAAAGYSSATTSFVARMSVAPTTAVKKGVDRVYFEIGATILAKLSCLWLPMLFDNEADMRLDLINTFNLVPYQSGAAVSGTASFGVVGFGYDPDGLSQYCDTTYDPTSSPVAMTSNGMSAGILMLGDSNVGLADLSSANNKLNIKGRIGTNGSFCAGTTSATNYPAGASVPWMAGVVRSDNGHQRGFINDQMVINAAVNSVAGLPSRFAISKSGSSGFSDRPWGAAFIGGDLIDDEYATVYRAILHCGQSRSVL